MPQLRTAQATMKTEDPAGCDHDPARPHKYILQRIALGTGDCLQTGNNNFSNSNIIIRVIGILSLPLLSELCCVCSDASVVSDSLRPPGL